MLPSVGIKLKCWFDSSHRTIPMLISVTGAPIVYSQLWCTHSLQWTNSLRQSMLPWRNCKHWFKNQTMSNSEAQHVNLLFVNSYFLALVRSQLIAKWADSFMTSPSWPVRVSWPSPSIRLASTNIISPPRGVQARPTATPGRVNRSDTLKTVTEKLSTQVKHRHEGSPSCYWWTAEDKDNDVGRRTTGTMCWWKPRHIQLCITMLYRLHPYCPILLPQSTLQQVLDHTPLTESGYLWDNSKEMGISRSYWMANICLTITKGSCWWSPTNLHVKKWWSQDVFQGHLVNHNGHLRGWSFVWTQWVVLLEILWFEVYKSKYENLCNLSW